MSITYSECVYVVVVIQHAMHLRYFVICGLQGSTVFLNIISKRHNFSRKKGIEHKSCVLIFSATFCVTHFHSKMNLTRYDKKCKLLFM